MSSIEQRKTPYVLRRAAPADVEFIMATERRPGFDLLVARGTDEEHAAAMIRPDTAYLVCERALDGPVGFAILEGLDDRHQGIKLRRIAVADPGLGHGQPFLAAIQAWVFGRPDVTRLWLDVFVDNARARHVYGRAGFAEDGLLRQAYVMPNGKRVDRMIMSILRDEWERR